MAKPCSILFGIPPQQGLNRRTVKEPAPLTITPGIGGRARIPAVTVVNDHPDFSCVMIPHPRGTHERVQFEDSCKTGASREITYLGTAAQRPAQRMINTMF